MPAFAFRYLDVSTRIEAKINGLHGVSIDDVLDVLEGLDYSRWDNDPTRGLRLIVVGSLRGRRIVVVLYPLDEAAGEWRLATAYRLDTT